MNFVDFDCECNQCANFAPPQKIIVSGAGTSSANGEYVYNGKYEGANQYVKEGSGNPKIYLWENSWYISFVPNGHSPSDTKGADIDYYSAPLSNENETIPPTTGWTRFGHGHAPCPTLRHDASDADGNSDVSSKKRRACTTCCHPFGVTIPYAESKISNRATSKECTSRLMELGKIWPKLDAVECKHDRDKVLAAFLIYVISDPCKEAQAWTAVHDALEHCETKECFTMLELAVWRSVCKMQVPKGISDYYACAEWHRAGWKKLKADMRRSGSINVIMTSVIPYIDNTSEE